MSRQKFAKRLGLRQPSGALSSDCPDSDIGEDSAFIGFRRDKLADPPALCFGAAREVRKYHLPDFSNWKHHDAFERAFARLEKDLRISIGK
jgi:hypothetical protein